MSDSAVEAYITTVFQCTPRKHQVTAPMEEWWALLPIINVRENYYIFTDEEIAALEPYCNNNPKAEMSPQDFTRLIGMIREADSEIQEPQIEITPEMSVSASLRHNNGNNNSNRMNYYDDIESLHHPEPHYNNTMADLNERRLTAQSPYGYNSEEIRKLKQDKSDLVIQLKENDNKIEEMAKEHLERIVQLEEKIQYLNVEKENQKALTNEHLHKEREKLDKIAELQNTAKGLEDKYNLSNKKLAKKEEDVSRLQEKLKQLEKENNQLRESISSRDSELAQSMDENTKLMEIIDKQKFDLDEARTGLNHFYSSNELEIDYAEKFNQLKKERDVLKFQIESSEEHVKNLSQQLDEHEKIAHEIKAHIHTTHPILQSSFIQRISYISWAYLLYHLILLALSFFALPPTIDPYLKNMDLYLYYYYGKA
ncbi:hypothetical protein BY458DRAFT_515027 [Sporodiniella umbellata]|nr:hypothetical protein BY458DRAFT_515027 [Sporodiniella umbellata]